MIPFIEISIISTTEEKKTKKELIQKIKERFERTHDLKGSWKGTNNSPVIRLDYTSKKAFLDGYTRDLELFNILIDEINLGNFPFNELFPKDSKQDEITENYIVLKYITNWKEPMVNNYQFTSKAAETIGVVFNIEEIEDGFLMFYQKKIDFDANQIDRLNIVELKKFFTENNLDLNLPSVQPLFKFLKDKSKKKQK
jgi:hypothetical protein